jgi:hypothetical protein
MKAPPESGVYSKKHLDPDFRSEKGNGGSVDPAWMTYSRPYYRLLLLARRSSD